VINLAVNTQTLILVGNSRVSRNLGALGGVVERKAKEFNNFKILAEMNRIAGKDAERLGSAKKNCSMDVSPATELTIQMELVFNHWSMTLASINERDEIARLQKNYAGILEPIEHPIFHWGLRALDGRAESNMTSMLTALEISLTLCKNDSEGELQVLRDMKELAIMGKLNGNLDKLRGKLLRSRAIAQANRIASALSEDREALFAQTGALNLPNVVSGLIVSGVLIDVAQVIAWIPDPQNAANHYVADMLDTQMPNDAKRERIIGEMGALPDSLLAMDSRIIVQFIDNAIKS
jgi:hypothetical protein